MVVVRKIRIFRLECSHCHLFIEQWGYARTERTEEVILDTIEVNKKFGHRFKEVE